MEFISNLVRDKFKISKKDNWNPADIWVIQNEQKAIDKIKEAVRGNYPTITELNNVMKAMWRDKELKGISLKAISGETAIWEEVNLDDSLFEDKKMIDIAHKYVMKIMLGCMVESSFGITAMSNLSPQVDFADLDGNLLINNDPYIGVEVIDGKLKLPSGDGLGLTLNPEHKKDFNNLR